MQIGRRVVIGLKASMRCEAMLDIEKRRDLIKNLIDEARRFRFCGPSDDPDEQTSVTLRLSVPTHPIQEASLHQFLRVQRRRDFKPLT